MQFNIMIYSDRQDYIKTLEERSDSLSRFFFKTDIDFNG